MAESTWLKELAAKMDTILTMLDQREEKMKGFEQSLTSLSQHMDNFHNAQTSSAIQPQGTPDAHTELPDAHTEIPQQLRAVWLDFPRFDGSGAMHWLYRAEQFFNFYDIHDPYRVKMASIHLDGETIPWFQMLQKSGVFSTWASFASAVEATYGPSLFECPRYALFKLRQTGTVSQYYSSFTSLATEWKGYHKQHF